MHDKNITPTIIKVSMSLQLLQQCRQALTGSPFDFETILGNAVIPVWQCIGKHLEDHLRLKRGTSLPGFGRFTFFRDIRPPQPIFLLSEAFMSLYNVQWRNRPVPSLVNSTVDINFLRIGNELSLSRDVTMQTWAAILKYIGVKLQRSEASGKIPIGPSSIVMLHLEGNSIRVVFTPNFVSSLRQDITIQKDLLSKGDFHMLSRVKTSHGMLESSSSPSLLMANPKISTMPDAVIASSIVEPIPSHSGVKNEHKHRNRRHSHKRKLINTPLQNETLKASGEHAPILQHTDSCHKQVLPRFLLHENGLLSKYSLLEREQDPNSKQFLVQKRAINRENERIQMNQERTTKVYKEIQKRSDYSTQTRLLKQAEKSIKDRELIDFLKDQMQEKNTKTHQEKLHRLRRENYDTNGLDQMTILPQEIINLTAQRDRKHKLLVHLHDQLTSKQNHKNATRTIDQAETAYFQAKVREQTERDNQEKAERKRKERELLIAGWKQDAIMQERLVDKSRYI